MILNKKYLEENLFLPIKTLIFEKAGSTNSVCKELAWKNSTDIAVIALEQSNGRGRLGRSFYSPSGTGIYISFLLHPEIPVSDCIKITAAAAVAASLAVDCVSEKHSLIKWVNDIYLDGRKVCGILTEAGLSKNKAVPDYAVLGVGFNLCPPKNGFPEDIKEKAGSILTDSAYINEKAVTLITEFTNTFLKLYSNFPNTDFMEEYKSRSMLTGKEVYCIKNNEKVFGTVLEINDNAELILKTDQGLLTLFAGEVSLKTE